MLVEGAATLAGAGMSAVGIKVLFDLLGPSLKVSGAMLADQFYAWKWQNRVRIAEKVKAICDEKQIASMILPPDYLMPVLEAAGNVENDDLQTLWANLLVSGMKDDSLRHPRFAHILSAMSASDAMLFKWICDKFFEHGWKWSFHSGPHLKVADLPPCGTWQATTYSIASLCDLGIVRDYQGASYIYEDLDSQIKIIEEDAVVASLGLPVTGRRFAEAIMGKPIPKC